MTIRTRFAPSPTGYLHIGGVRTALFNWLLSKRHGGQWILRIDDTDTERNKAEALLPIIEGFQWLGMDWNEGPTPDGLSSIGPFAPYFQGQRTERYFEVAMKLLAEGKLYPDYTPADEMEAARKAAELAKKPYVHRGKDRHHSAEENLVKYQAQPTILRLKVPENQTIQIQDHVRGLVEVQSNTIADPVVMRAPDSNGSRPRPLYNFASVIDDIDFQVTHVIRAIEHLSNTPVQVLIWQALNAPVPQFAHIPLVNYNGKKMSKRALPPLSTEEISKLKACGWTTEEIQGRDDLNLCTVAYYREMGYLPEAIINYLGRLGWSLDDHSEFIPLDQMIANFSLERITSAPANFDSKKLFWLQGEYMKLVPTEKKLQRCIPYLRKAKLIGETLDEKTKTILTQIIDSSGDRIKLFSDILMFATPILKDQIEYDPKGVEKRLKGQGETLKKFRLTLESVEPWDVPTLDRILHEFAENHKIKPGDIVNPMRVAVTGMQVGFGLFETLAILGKEKTLARLDYALHHLC